MAATPPSLEQSTKRILPAFLLCAVAGFFGLHRFYAGKFVSGIVQLAVFAGALVWLQRACAGVFQITTIDEAMAWAQAQGNAPLAPLLLILAASILPVIDCIRLAAGKFRDGK